MFPKLQNSPKFKKEIKLFEKSLKECPKEQLNQFTILLSRYKNAVNQIDDGHDTLSGSVIDPRLLIEIRSELNETRLKILEIIKKYNLDH